MVNLVIYHALRLAMLECRQSVMCEKITDDEADELFETRYAQLKQDYDPTQVDLAYTAFNADLTLMDWLQWLEQGGQSGQMLALLIIRFGPDEKIARVCRNWRELVCLDESFEANQPAAVGV